MNEILHSQPAVVASLSYYGVKSHLVQDSRDSVLEISTGVLYSQTCNMKKGMSLGS